MAYIEKGIYRSTLRMGLCTVIMMMMTTTMMILYSTIPPQSLYLPCTSLIISLSA